MFLCIYPYLVTGTGFTWRYVRRILHYAMGTD